MGIVTILPPELVNKIAAGEVIERPASVVKELVENALDAGATHIDISIKQAGRSLMRIRDNGHGIHHDDLEKIFLRHATSKISTIDDLFAISSFGFRGEALYSIAAVSDITVRSRTADQDTGWEIHLRGGTKCAERPLGMPVGTEVEIQELFFNTPARRKFLKKDSTESGHIISTIIPYTLCHPECGFKLTTDSRAQDRVVFDLSPETSLAERAGHVLNLNREYILEADDMLSETQTSLHMLLGDSNIRRSKKDLQFIFINGRPVSSRNLSFHVNTTYRLIFPTEVYPFFALFITLPPGEVDANIHPTKREVKITHEHEIIARIRRLCEDTLMLRSKAKQVDHSSFHFEKNPTGVDTAPTPLASSRAYAIPPDLGLSIHETRSPEYIAQATQNLLEPLEESFDDAQTQSLKRKLETARYIGTFLKKYILFESPDSLLVIDQHAAQERIRFESLIQQVDTNAVEIQQLITPLVLQLSPHEFLVWEEIKNELTFLGFTTNQWDPESIALQSHPQLITDPEIALRNLLSGEDIKRYDRETLARRACRSSIMAGDTIEKEGAQAIRTNLLCTQDPFTCPHGRPTVIELREKLLHKQFLRT